MKPKHAKRIGCLTAVLLAAVLTALAVFLICQSKYALQTTEYEIFSEKLPDSFDGFRIVQLSDLHGAEFSEENAQLISEVCALAPDIIALTGDFVTDDSDIGTLRALLPALSAICPVYFISGNHEYGSGLAAEVKNIAADAGIKYLSNEFSAISRGEDCIILGGVEDPLAYAEMLTPEELADAMCTASPEAFRILLGHRNYWMREYPGLPVDLILCGHAHGGLIRIPGIGGLIGTDRQLFPDYEAGLFDNGAYTMIVSRGLGNSVPVPRFLNRPEIVCVTLRAQA